MVKKAGCRKRLWKKPPSNNFICWQTYTIGGKAVYKNMNKEELLKILQGLLKTDAALTFLLYLKKDELERLVAVVRDRVEGCNKD
jgi:hypothetical protein